MRICPALCYNNSSITITYAPPSAKAGNLLSLSICILSGASYATTAPQPNCLITNQFLGKILFKMPPSFSQIHKTKLGFPMNNFYCKAQNLEAPIAAVIIDLDGTILNTEQATKGVPGELLARYGKVLDREKEDKRLGMMQNEAASSFVKDYELPITPDCYIQEVMPMYQERWVHAKALPGANRFIQHLHNRGVPFALASNSKRKNIDTKISHLQGWRELFAVILGSDQVNKGKPSPDLFLEAAKQMGVDPVHCLVIEDSLVGVKAARAAGMKVVAVASLPNAADQYSNADSVLHSLLELQPELWGLPPFDDWVDKALPMDEPFYVKGWFSKGLLILSEDSEETCIPDQLFGLFFGWATFDAHEVFKFVACIGWEHDCCSFKRKILLHLLDVSNQVICDQEVQILFVGYIRGLSNEENKANDIAIPEEDKSIARESLDLPEFTRYKSALVFPEASFVDEYAASDENEY